MSKEIAQSRSYTTDGDANNKATAEVNKGGKRKKETIHFACLNLNNLPPVQGDTPLHRN